MQNHNKQQPPKNQPIPNEMLDIDNNDNLEAAEASSNFIQKSGFWISTVTSAVSIAIILYSASLEGLQQIIPDIIQLVNDNWVYQVGLSIFPALIGFRLAKLMDFNLINIHGRAALTELFIFYKIWTAKKQDAALGRYRNGITFFRVVNATIQLLFLFVGYSGSFFTSYLGSAEIGTYIMNNNGSELNAEIKRIEDDKDESLKHYILDEKTALDNFYSQKKQAVELQVKPYEKALKKGNAMAIFKVDSISKAVNAQSANQEKKLNEALVKKNKDWEDSFGAGYANALEKAKKNNQSQDNTENMFKSGIKFIGTFAVTFSLLILVLQCMGEVSRKAIVRKEVDVSKIVQAGTQGKNSNNNPN